MFLSRALNFQINLVQKSKYRVKSCLRILQSRMMRYFWQYACTLCLYTGILSFFFSKTNYSITNYSTTNYNTTNYSTTNYSTTNYNTKNYSTTNYSTTNFSTTNFSTTNFSTTNYSTTNYSTTNYSTTNYSTTNYRTTNYSKTNYSTTNYSTTNFSTTNYSTTNYSIKNYITTNKQVQKSSRLSILRITANIQGDPQRMRLQKRLYRIYILCFLILIIHCNCKLFSFFSKSLNEP